MKIAQIAPLVERIPPKKYGGTERVVYTLTEELVKRGHDVTLFASGDSITSAKLVSVFPESLREAHMSYPNPAHLWTACNSAAAYQRQEEFDVIHDHTGLNGLAAATISKTPVVITLHGAFNNENKKIFQKLVKNSRNVGFVSISNSQRKPLPALPYVGTVYNGLDLTQYPFSKTHQGYLLFVGRISEEKGVHHAIKIAKKLSLPLVIAAKLEDHNRTYFEKYVEPHLSPSIRFVGEVNETKRNELMKNALCFLHPVTWREPFGLVLIEAMATGCPVVAFNRGSIPEVIYDGKTGFIAKNENGMIQAVRKINTIDRKDCRAHALENFSAEKMADGYEAVYQKILIEHDLDRKEWFFQNELHKHALAIS